VRSISVGSLKLFKVPLEIFDALRAVTEDPSPENLVAVNVLAPEFQVRPALPVIALPPFHNINCPDEPVPWGTLLGRLDALRFVMEFPSPENFVAANVLVPDVHVRPALPVIALPPFHNINCPDEPVP